MKRKVNVNRPQISSEEIAKRKNFDSVLKQSAGAGGGMKPIYKKPWFLTSVVAVAVAVVATVAVMKKNNDPQLVQSEQVVVNAEENAALEAFYKSEESKPCISPPIKGLNVEYTTFKVIAEKGAELNYKTGSKIRIPKNAFADASGNVLKGEVELRYREFHDAVDFFVSGIPMTYDSAGVTYQFESAGMIEVLAYQNGKQLNMAPDKEIKFEMASEQSGEYNFYKLDTVRNNWSCLGKDKVMPRKNEVAAVEVPVAKVEELPEFKELEVKKVEAKKEKEAAIAILPKPAAEPVKPEQVKKGKYTFNLDINEKEFPEFASYKGVLFEVGSENKDFNASMYDIVWEDATLKEGTKGTQNYNLTLKKGAKKYNLVVYPVFEGKNYETAMKNFQEKYSKYKVTLDKRVAEEKRLEEEYKAKVAEYVKEQQELAKKQQAALLAMNANSDIGTIRRKEVESQFRQGTEGEKVYRMFAVKSFGVFNSDNPSLYPQGILCKANLKSADNRSLKCYDVYLVDSERNALFAYYRNPVHDFSFNPKSKSMLWTVEDGVLYWLKPEQFAGIKSSDEETQVVLTKVDQKFKDVEEMKAYFNF